LKKWLEKFQLLFTLDIGNKRLNIGHYHLLWKLDIIEAEKVILHAYYYLCLLTLILQVGWSEFSCAMFYKRFVFHSLLSLSIGPCFLSLLFVSILPNLETKKGLSRWDPFLSDVLDRWSEEDHSPWSILSLSVDINVPSWDTEVLRCDLKWLIQ